MCITNVQKEEMDISAFLNQYVYQDDQDVNYRGKTIDEIVEKSSNLKNNEVFMDILEANPEWGGIELISQSSIDGKTSMEELIACTFKDPKTGDVYVSYRGTGDGKWVDNGVGIANENSIMQVRAEEYFNHVIEDPANGLMNYQGGKIIVTGHSKGGNSAQYVTMSSMYGHLIDNCYSMNGQGFSQDAINRFKELYGKEYYANQIDKLTGINGHNDYVSPLGISIIKDENKIYFNSTTGDGFANWHQNEGFFKFEYDENGEVIPGSGRINFLYEKGEIVTSDRGYMSVFAGQLSERMMELNQEDLEDCTVTIMTILEKKMGNSLTGENLQYGTGDVQTASLEEWCGFIAVGVPLIIDTAADSEEAKIIITDFLNDAINSVLNSEYGVLKVAGIATAVAFLAPIALNIAAELWLVSLSIELLLDLAEKIKEFGKEIYSYCVNLANIIKEFEKKLNEWFNSNFNIGYRYATANPNILVDTYKLRSYATRLNSVNRRVSSLDSRLNSLYRRVCDFEDLISTANALWNLLQADALTSYSLRLKKCSSYLDETADDFEKTEKNIVNKAI